ncbi:MAG: hypothetical protein HY272_09805 [Gammaproteobacteria bacterium]|nr:hypothetical protein [Gammaproteobacteria bacterium]
MTKLLNFIAALVVSGNVFAAQETFTTAGPLDCTAVIYCVQNTSDNLFTLKFVPTYPTSAPSATGFNVNEPSIEVSNANGGLLDLTIMQVSMTGSNAYNGMNFIGAIMLEVQDSLGNWSYASQWSTYIGSKGIYVMFNGRNASSPLVKGVKAIRLTGVNGATAFRIGMMNLIPY